MKFRHFKKSKTVAGAISLAISLITFIIALLVMIHYLKIGQVELSSTILVPLLVTTVLVISVASLAAFLSLGSVYGKFVFLINLSSVIFIIVSFITLYQ